LDRALQVVALVGALVHQDVHEVHLGVVGRDRVRDVLQHQGLARLGRGDDEAALTLADRGDEVDDPRGQVLLLGLQAEPLLGVQRGQLAELGTVLGLLRRHPVDRVQAHERVVLLAPAALLLLLAAGLDRAGDGVTLAQAVLADHAHGDVDVVRAGQVAGGPDEAVVVEQVEHTGDGDEHVLLGVGLLLLGEALAAALAVAVALAVPAPLAVAPPAAAAAALLVVAASVLAVAVVLAVALLGTATLGAGVALAVLVGPLAARLPLALLGRALVLARLPLAPVPLAGVLAAGLLRPGLDLGAVALGPGPVGLRRRRRGGALGRLGRRGRLRGGRLGTTTGAVPGGAAVLPDGLDQVGLAHLGRHGDAHAAGQALQLGDAHRAQRAGGAGRGGNVSGVCHEGSFPLVGAVRFTQGRPGVR